MDMKPERNRRDLRAKACERSARTSEAYWEWAMREAQWQINMGRFRLARLAINSARELRQFCRVMP